jgi:hypothetical protein
LDVGRSIATILSMAVPHGPFEQWGIQFADYGTPKVGIFGEILEEANAANGSRDA